MESSFPCGCYPGLSASALLPELLQGPELSREKYLPFDLWFSFIYLIKGLIVCVFD